MAAAPDAVILALAGKPTIEVIKAVNKQHKGLQLYALSVLASAANLKALGPDGVGVAISQVVPFPSRGSMPLVREYQAAMTAAGQTEFSHLSLEGYMNAKVMAEALRRTGPKPTREGLVSALQSMKDYDLGGLVVNFSKGAASASRLVELTVVGNRGNLVK
jgi:ABC-type branched-subunit amino acid transport system substrate-binding protein